MTEIERVQSFLLETAKMMVDHPDSVEVEVTESGERVTLRLHVHPSDIGKMIGKQGRTAHTLRTAVGATAAKMNKSFALDIADDAAEQRHSP